MPGTLSACPKVRAQEFTSSENRQLQDAGTYPEGENLVSFSDGEVPRGFKFKVLGGSGSWDLGIVREFIALAERVRTALGSGFRGLLDYWDC